MPTFTPPPDQPLRTDAPASFISKAFAFIGWFTTMVSEFTAFAASLSLVSTTDTSASSVAIGTGAKNFTVSTGKSFSPGMALVIADAAAPSTNYMNAIITSYSGTALIVDVKTTAGSGTKNNWVISQSGNLAIADATVTTAKLVDLNVTTNKLNDLAVTTAKISDDAITAQKLADSALGDVLINGYINIPAPSGNAITINIKTKAGTDPSAADPVLVVFRTSTLGGSGYNVRSITAATSITISSGSTLGTVNAVLARIGVLLLDNAGTVELAVTNLSVTSLLDETNLISTTAEGGAGGADSASVIYSTTARSNLPYRVAGFFDSTQATAGTYVTAPSLVQNAFGRAFGGAMGILNGVPIPTTSGTSIDFTGIPPLVKRITLLLNGVSTNGTSAVQIQLGSGSITTSGYTSCGADIVGAGATGGVSSTSGIILERPNNVGAAGVRKYVITLVNVPTTNTWLCFSNGVSGTTNLFGGGDISLSGILDRLRLTSVIGTDVFDLGSAVILCE